MRAETPRLILSFALLAPMALVVRAGGVVRAQSSADEYRVKAAFLFHFAQLVDWPPEAMSSGDRWLTLCTVGQDPFRGQLESTMGNKLIGTRVIRIRHLMEN